MSNTFVISTQLEECSSPIKSSSYTYGPPVTEKQLEYQAKSAGVGNRRAGFQSQLYSVTLSKALYLPEPHFSHFCIKNTTSMSQDCVRSGKVVNVEFLTAADLKHWTEERHSCTALPSLLPPGTKAHWRKPWNRQANTFQVEGTRLPFQGC